MKDHQILGYSKCMLTNQLYGMMVILFLSLENFPPPLCNLIWFLRAREVMLSVEITVDHGSWMCYDFCVLCIFRYML